MATILDKLREDIELRNYSENTRKLYCSVCEDYLGFIGGRPLEDTTEEDIRAYSLHMKNDRGLAPATVNCYLSAVLFLYEVSADITCNRRQVPFMKLPKRLPTVFTREEVRSAISAAAGARDAAIVSVAYGSGLRVSEVCELRIRDIDSDSMRLRVEDGKGMKERLTLLSESTLGLLRAHFAESLVGTPRDPAGFLFPGGSDGHLSDDAVRDALDRCLGLAGVERGDRTFHSLRYRNLQVIRTFAGKAWQARRCA